MKILSIRVGSNILFPEGINIDLKTSDRVRKGLERHDYYRSAYQIKTGIYNQVLMSVVGLNATGKTAILQLICFIANIVLLHRSLDTVAYLLEKFHVTKEHPFKFSVEIFHENNVYLLESEIIKDNGSYFYKDEILYKLPLSKFARNINKNSFKIVMNRKDEATNVFLKSDESIIKCISSQKGTFVCNLGAVNFNYPGWEGEPPSQIIKIFDSGIKSLKIENSEFCEIKKAKALIQFERESGVSEKSLITLENIVSSGTIKGLTIFPGLMSVLSSGGLIVLDEIENHLNKKLITFILDLFTDKRTNPKGGCLIFSTHYPELLDYFTRKDNIYVSRKDDDENLHLLRFSDSDKVKRNDILKSKILLLNVINGTAPKFSLLTEAKNKVIELLNLEDQSVG